MTEPRLPPIDPDDLDDAQRALHDRLMDRPEVQAHGLVGPFGVWMHAPEAGSAMAALGAVIRFGTALPTSVTEVAICTTGAHHRAAFEFAAHRRLAVQAGVDADALDRLARAEEPGFDGDEALAHAFASQLLRTGDVDDGTYADAVARFGERGVVELVSTVGYYGLISHLLNVFHVPLAPGMDDPFES
jgi:4-carboxymuconolactone decarboxylase